MGLECRVATRLDSSRTTYQYILRLYGTSNAAMEFLAIAGSANAMPCVLCIQGTISLANIMLRKQLGHLYINVFIILFSASISLLFGIRELTYSENPPLDHKSSSVVMFSILYCSVEMFTCSSQHVLLSSGCDYLFSFPICCMDLSKCVYPVGEMNSV